MISFRCTNRQFLKAIIVLLVSTCFGAPRKPLATLFDFARLDDVMATYNFDDEPETPEVEELETPEVAGSNLNVAATAESGYNANRKSLHQLLQQILTLKARLLANRYRSTAAGDESSQTGNSAAEIDGKKVGSFDEMIEKMMSTPIDFGNGSDLWYAILYAAVHDDGDEMLSIRAPNVGTDDNVERMKNETGSAAYKRSPARDKMLFHRSPLLKKLLACPSEGAKRKAIGMVTCPTVDSEGNFLCIDEFHLCDRIAHCPQAEDEDPTLCMFHHLVTQYLTLIVEAFVLVAHGLN